MKSLQRREKILLGVLVLLVCIVLAVSAVGSIESPRGLLEAIFAATIVPFATLWALRLLRSGIFGQ